MDKTSAKKSDTVTYTVRFAEGSTPTLSLSGNTGTLSTPTKSATENKWTYTYVVTAGDSDISATATFAAKKVGRITNSTGATLFADDANNNDAGALKAYLDGNIKVTATYDNGTTAQMAAAYTLKTDTWSATGGSYAYTATAGGKTCDVSVNVKAVNAAVSAIADINKVKDVANGYPTHALIGLPEKATITYTGDDYTAKTADLTINWTTAVPKDFGKTPVTEQAFSGTVALPAWATGTNAVTAKVNIADKASIADALTVSISGWTFGDTAKAPTAGKKAGSAVIIDNTKFTFVYNGTANDGTTLTDSATAPTKAGTYTVTAKYEDETQIGSVISDSFRIARKSITPILTVTGVTKVYDGKVTVEGTQPVISFTGTLGSDVPVATATYNYDTATVGTGKTINATAIALTANAVNQNYTLTKTTASAVGAEITSAEPDLTVPTNLHAITNTQKTLADVKFENHDGTGAGTWAWKAPETTLTASDDAKTQAFTAVFTPTDTVNYKAVEKDVSIKVSEIIAKFDSLDIKEIKTVGGTVTISATITVKGAALDGDIALDKVVTWDNSCPEIVTVTPNNSGAAYKATVTGVKKGISMVGIAVSSKPVSSVMVKYAPPSGGDSNNAAEDINNVSDTISAIVSDPDSMTTTEKAVVNAAATELMSLPQAAKENLSTKAIENLDGLYQKSVGITTQNEVITDGVSNPIFAGDVAIKGMALASGATSAAAVKVEIKQQNPTQTASGKKAELEFEMKLTVGGTEKELQAPLLISLLLPSGINTDGMIIKHTKSSGVSEEITYADTLSSGQYTLSGNTATMWVNSFSTFTFLTVAPTPPVDPNPGDNNGGSGGNGGGGSSTTYYTITATAGAGGSISTGKSVSVREGDSAGFTMTPDKGYIIADVKVNGKSVGAVKNYVFTNVRSHQTIEVTFKASGGHVNPQTGVAFEDVAENDWFYESVYNAVEKGWFTGTSDKTFTPNSDTTRGMIATVLHRMENEPTATAASIFEDVASGAYYAGGVNWAQENGIVGGYGNGKFGPQDNITREQMTSILYRYAQFKSCDVTKTTFLDSFSDAGSVSNYAVEPMQWAVANGLITGKSNGILDPKGSATRAQVAAILTRFDELFSEE